MMKKILYILTAFLMALLTIRAQEVIEEDSLYANTRYGELLLNRGCFVKRVDSNISNFNVNGDYTIIYSLIRSIYINERTSGYFYNLSRKNTLSGDFSVYIWYKDIDEIIKAIYKLQECIKEDCENKMEHVKNCYITQDGFEIGYTVRKKGKKAKWYMKCLRYVPELEIKIETILSAFQTAQEQIGEILQRDRNYFEIMGDKE